MCGVLPHPVCSSIYSTKCAGCSGGKGTEYGATCSAILGLPVSRR